MIDIVAEHPHYADHIRPIWDALPPELKGTDWGAGPALPSNNLLLVAGYSDVKRHRHHRIIYLEHGAGQSYIGLDIGAQPFYSGGPQHRNVVGYLCPNQSVAYRWNARYPDVTTQVIGCPKLDALHGSVPEDRTVAITFHWNASATGVPETGTAFGHYVQALPDIIQRWRSSGWHVLGHAHPRYRALADFWQIPEMRTMVEWCPSGSDILARAGVLVADNTSLQPEALSLGRSVVWLNCPEYRRNVHHGGRFWEWPEMSGVSVDGPSELLRLDLDDVPVSGGHPYAYADSMASERAVASLKFMVYQMA